ncbi:MAG TPA: sortase [Rubrobacter sp.]|nr:sortase [Rubrobacter sp.]
MFAEGNSLLKVGVIMIALALALVIAAVVVSATVGSEPERLLAAEITTKSPGEAPSYSSGKEGSVTKNSSSQKESPRSSSGKKEKESLSYGSSSSGGPVEQRKEEIKEPQAVLQQEAEPPKSQSPTPQLAGKQTPSEASSGSQLQPQPQQHQPHQQDQPLPDAEQRGWPEPTQAELQSAKGARHYELLPGAIMGLTIEAIGIHDVPVFDSESQWALANGVAHNPQTSLPWTATPQRNVYLAGHRMGFRGTWSRMIFYNLHKLDTGDKVLLKDRAGRSYRYSVSEVFIADPRDVWVMGQVRGRDMVTLQTCTPYPTFEKRLIVRADRV